MFQKFLRFILAGGLSYTINLWITYGLHDILWLSKEISYALALILNSLITFIISLKFTFQSQFSPQVLIKYIIALGSISLCNYILTLYLDSHFSKLYSIIFIVTSLFVIVKFVVYNHFVFPDKKTWNS